MSEIASVLGIGPKLTFEGVEYRIGPRDFEVEAEMERHLIAEDLKTLKRFAKDLGPQEYQQQLQQWRLNATSRVWSYGSPDFVRYYCSPTGMKHSAWLQLARHNPTASMDVVERIYQDDAKWEELWTLIGVANQGPLEGGPTTTTSP